MELVFDIETDGLYSACTKIHCIAAVDILSDRTYTFGPDQIQEGLAFLAQATTLVGHSISSFDLPVIEKLYPDADIEPTCAFDTLVAARLVCPDVKADDYRYRASTMPKNLVGKHSLEAWGHRLKVLKGTYGKTADWKTYSEEMLAYCLQDTLVTKALYLYLGGQGAVASGARILEQDFSRNIARMSDRGVAFDKPAADRLVCVLQAERASLDQQIKAVCPDFVDKYLTPKRQIEKTKTTVFNPGSRDHIARHLMERHGWEPTDFTDTGKPQIDEDVLEPIQVPEAKLFSRRFLVEKRLGQIAEGKEAWIDRCREDGRIHGYVNHNGAVTGRCTHSGPNTAQVPRCSTLYGRECRSLFVAQKGYKLVGCDAKGLELRCLAHYMARYDDGAYGKIVCFGDPHTENQKAAGLDTRDKAKTFIYALLYGAGDTKIGSISGGTSKDGKALRSRFMKNLPAFARLKADLEAVVRSSKKIRGIDRRLIPIRAEHAALNTLLQSAGAILMKQATNIACEVLLDRGIRGGLVLHVHDEFQFEIEESRAEEFRALLPWCIEEAGKVLGFRVPMTGDAKIGSNWAETH